MSDIEGGESETPASPSESLSEERCATYEYHGITSRSVIPIEDNVDMSRIIDVMRMDDWLQGNGKTDEECVEFIKSVPFHKLNLVTKTSGSILNVAAKHNRVTVVAHLLSAQNFHQIAARSCQGRTALHDAILRRNNWYELGMHMHLAADTPAVDALTEMLNHPRCDVLVNAHDEFNLPPFFYALRAYLRSRWDLMNSNSAYCDAAVELACMQTKPCEAFLQHPCFYCPSVKVLDIDDTLDAPPGRPSLVDSFFMIGSQILHHPSVMRFEIGCNPFAHDRFNKHLKNDMLQYVFGPVLRQICTSRKIAFTEILPLLKEFLGFDLAAEKILHKNIIGHRHAAMREVRL